MIHTYIPLIYIAPTLYSLTCKKYGACLPTYPPYIPTFLFHVSKPSKFLITT